MMAASERKEIAVERLTNTFAPIKSKENAIHNTAS